MWRSIPTGERTSRPAQAPRPPAAQGVTSAGERRGGHAGEPARADGADRYVVGAGEVVQAVLELEGARGGPRPAAPRDATLLHDRDAPGHPAAGVLDLEP